MAEHVIKLPDVGEGVAEAELVEWSVSRGDLVAEDQVVAAVMTDKATVEIPSPVSGRVTWMADGKIGETIAVGAPLLRIELDLEVALPEEDQKPSTSDAVEAKPTVPEQAPAPKAADEERPEPRERKADAVAGKPIAAPSVRGRARNAGVDLHFVTGSGPAGRITHEDLDAYLAGSRNRAGPRHAPDTVKEIPVIGLRRRISQRMAEAKRRIPHITIVEEVDMTALEDVRERLNAEKTGDKPKLTVLPFLMAAIVKAVKEQPALNAHFDDEAEVVRQFSAVHIGIATQTGGGLMVPVVAHAERLSLWDAATALSEVAEAARNGTAKREQLSGSTISITSLGALGAIATTPIINQPEVAIVGVNRMQVRPVWNGSEFVPRKMMNLSSSFDHRVIDGWDAALFVKRLKDLLETPTLIFVER